jgi:hypothetical protein
MMLEKRKMRKYLTLLFSDDIQTIKLHIICLKRHIQGARNLAENSESELYVTIISIFSFFLALLVSFSRHQFFDR